MLTAALAVAVAMPAGAKDLEDPQPYRRLSAGCRGPAPADAPRSVTVAGRERELIAVVPDRPGRPHRLVVAFHGRTNSAGQVRRYFDLERHAAAPTIFVYPSGLLDKSGRNTWSDPGDKPGHLRDLALFDAILARFSESHCLDLDSVFVVGHSLGAWFANSVACARGDVVRGVATIGGGIAHKACDGPVAAMLLHNPKDRLVEIEQGLRARNAFLEENGLPLGSDPVEPDRFACRRYGPDGGENPVVWCPHHDDRTYGGRYYPHQWPRGSGEAIMEFFMALD